MENELTAFLSDVLPFWNSLDGAQKSRLENAAALKSLQPGDSFGGEDEDCSGLYIVKSGRVRVYIISETGREITLYRLLERDICLFSASCLLKNINFKTYTQAETETEAVLIPTHAYQLISQNSPEVAGFTSQLMASRFTDVMWVMEQVLFSSFDSRLASFLLEQSNLVESDRLAITQEEIANHMGSAREVVNRMLKYFRDEGAVELFRGGVLIKDRKKLQNLT